MNSASPLQNSRSLWLVAAILLAIPFVPRIEGSDVNDGHFHSSDHSDGQEDLLIIHDDVTSQGGSQALRVKAADALPQWDDNGYVMFCPCMGRFGNQMDHLLGGLAFAKTVNRTLILPVMREDLTSFSDFVEWFQIEPLLEFHRVITGSDFMEYLAEDHWPLEKRRGYCRRHVLDHNQCQLKRGMPHRAFWDHFNIDFAGEVGYDLQDEVDYSIESEVKLLRRHWAEEFPAAEHPVLTMYSVPGTFPVTPGNRFIQKYFRWTPVLLAEADRIKRKLFKGESYLGIHLRVGEDWGRVCELCVGKSSSYFASPQCKSPSHAVMFQDMCYPPVEKIMELTREAMVTFDLRHLYIASDDKPYKEEFKEVLSDLNVTVHHYNPLGPQMDLIILGEADFFIGNCVSTFTSAIKRERDVFQRPSTFWGYPL